MPNIYKNHNYDSILATLLTMERQPDDRPKWQIAFNLFKNEKLDAFAYLWRLALDYNHPENIAVKALVLKDGEIDSQNINTIVTNISGISNKSKQGKDITANIDALKNVFGSSTGGDIGKLAGIAAIATAVFPNPVTGIIAGALAIVAGVWNIFTSPGKTASYDSKERMRTVRERFRTLTNRVPGESEGFKVLRRFYHQTGWYLESYTNRRPLCVAGTDACELEHFRFALRSDITRNSVLAVEDILKRYFQSFADFKKFIDDYTQIIPVVNNLTNGQGNQFSEPTKNIDSPPVSKGKVLLALGSLASIPFLPKIFK